MIGHYLAPAHRAHRANHQHHLSMPVMLTNSDTGGAGPHGTRNRWTSTGASGQQRRTRIARHKTSPRRPRTVEAMLASMDVPFELSRARVEAIRPRVRAPLLIIHGDDNRCQPLARAQRLAELTGARLVVLEAPATPDSQAPHHDHPPHEGLRGPAHQPPVASSAPLDRHLAFRQDRLHQGSPGGLPTTAIASVLVRAGTGFQPSSGRHPLRWEGHR
jgi:hypothetical protein